MLSFNYFHTSYAVTLRDHITFIIIIAIVIFVFIIARIKINNIHLKRLPSLLPAIVLWLRPVHLAPSVQEELPPAGEQLQLPQRRVALPPHAVALPAQPVALEGLVGAVATQARALADLVVARAAQARDDAAQVLVLARLLVEPAPQRRRLVGLEVQLPERLVAPVQRAVVGPAELCVLAL